MQDKSTQKQTQKQFSPERKRSMRNRKRSKRRAIFCDIHHCHLESVSPKYKLDDFLARKIQEVQVDGRKSNTIDGSEREKSTKREWLEAFSCPECRKKRWYHVVETSPRCYSVNVASDATSEEFLSGAFLKYLRNAVEITEDGFCNLNCADVNHCS